jgi:lipopolysaccharide export system protein LptC
MDARFALAARHSRMVRVLRIAVPGAVILAMTAIVLIGSTIRSGCFCRNCR